MCSHDSNADVQHIGALLKSSATSDAGGGNYGFKSHSGSVSEVESWMLMPFELFHVKKFVHTCTLGEPALHCEVLA